MKKCDKIKIAQSNSRFFSPVTGFQVGVTPEVPDE